VKNPVSGYALGNYFFWTLALLFCSASPALGQKESAINETPATTFEQIEVDSIAFVEENHPELATLLKSLKTMRQKEYESAIRETWRTKKRLESLSKKETDLHTMELDAWKLKSKIDLLIARGIAQDKTFTQSELRELLKQQIENQKKRWKHEQSTLAKRQEQIAEQLSRVEGHEDERTDQQLANHLKNVDLKIGKAKKPKTESRPAKEEREKP
jgi:hypothetical protein